MFLLLELRMGLIEGTRGRRGRLMRCYLHWCLSISSKCIWFAQARIKSLAGAGAFLDLIALVHARARCKEIQGN